MYKQFKKKKSNASEVLIRPVNAVYMDTYEYI